MSKIYTTMDSGERNCAVCGGELKPVIYYQARPIKVDVNKSVSDETLRKVYTTTKTTTYTDISKHTGSICGSCGLKKYKSTRALGLNMIKAGGGLFILSIILARVFGESIYLSIFAIIAFIIGIVLAIAGKKYICFKKSAKYVDYSDSLSALFVENIDRKKIAAGFQILSTAFYNRLSSSK